MLASTAYLQTLLFCLQFRQFFLLDYAFLLSTAAFSEFICANAAFHHTFPKRSRLCFVYFPLMHKLTHECFFMFAEHFCAFPSVCSFHNQALFVPIFMHVNISAYVHFSRCFDSRKPNAYSASFYSGMKSE